QDAAAGPRPPQRERGDPRELPGLRQSGGTPGTTQGRAGPREQPGPSRSRGSPGSTQDRAGAEGAPEPPRTEQERGEPRGAAGVKQEQREPREQPGPSRSRGSPGSSQDRAGAEGPPGRPCCRQVRRVQRCPAGTRGCFSSSGPAVAGGLLGTPLTRSPPSMAQWQEVQSLANTYLEQVHQLYAGSALPMAVRQCLAAWIESQNWRQAAEPLSSHAPMLFHSLLVLLGESLGSLGSGYEDFMLKHNLRKAHRDLQAEFGKNPERFANLVANLLQEERRILRLGQAGG
ncbi:STAT1 protein, partial [Nicator chloris]|nr:STAT1 protein [Nicator chloris]